MKNDAQLVLRLPEKLLKQIDALVADMAKETRFRVTRAEIARMLLEESICRRSKKPTRGPC